MQFSCASYAMWPWSRCVASRDHVLCSFTHHQRVKEYVAMYLVQSLPTVYTRTRTIQEDQT